MKIQKFITPLLNTKFIRTSQINLMNYQFSTSNYRYPAIKVVKPSEKGISLIKIAKNLNSMQKA